MQLHPRYPDRVRQKSKQALSELSESLVRRVRAEEDGAWEALVEQFEALVYAIPREMGLSDPDCDEVFQITWTLLYKQIHNLRQPGALPAWLITTANRHAWRLVQRARRRREIETPASIPVSADEHAGPLEETETLERRQLVRDSLSDISERCRALLERLYFSQEDSSYADVAESLEMPVGSVGPTRLRCLASLAQALERRGLR